MIFGVLGTLLFYADVTSDLLLTYDLYVTGNVHWASLTLAFIALQYVAAW